MRTALTTLLAFVSICVSGGNLVYNSGFELGSTAGHNVNRQVVGWERFADLKVLISTNAHSGTYSIICPNSAGWASRLIRLPVATTTNYTFSASVRGVNCNPLWFAVAQPTDALGYTNTGWTPTTSWSRFTTTITVTPNSSGEVYFGLAQFANNGTFWLDDIQLELGSVATTYAPAPDDMLWVGDRLGNIIIPGMSSRAGLKLYSDVATNQTVRVETYDWLNKLVSTVTTNIAVNGLTTTWLSLPNSNGTFRVVARMSGSDRVTESQFTILPAPATNTVLGTHMPSDAYMTDWWRTNTGIVLNRSLSPGLFFRWGQIETSPGTYTWTDADAAVNACTNGTLVLASLSEATTNDLQHTYIPPWAFTGNRLETDLTMWSNYVYAVVSRYNTKITRWSGWNEYRGNNTCDEKFTAAWAVQMESITANVIKAINPSATYIAFGGMAYCWDYTDTIWTNIAPATRAKIDGAEVHLYPGGSPFSDPDSSGNYPYWAAWSTTNLPIWNTESGGFTKFPVRSLRYWGSSATETWRGIHWDGVTRTVVPFLRSVGWGFAKHFYYDAREPYPEYYWDVATTLWNKDESMATPGGILLWAANRLGTAPKTGGHLTFPGTSGLVEAFVIDRGDGNAVLALWSEQKTNRTFTLTNAFFAVYDTMGNQVQTNNATVALGITPLYLLSTTLGTNALAHAFTSGSCVTNADTVAPYVAIDDTPYGTIPASQSVRFRWAAWDNTSMDTDIQTRYSLTNAVWSAWSGSERQRGPISLPAGTYALTVESKDGAGNTSSVTGPTFTIGNPVVPNPPVIRARLGGLVILNGRERL